MPHSSMSSTSGVQAADHRRARHAVRGGILGNFVDQFDIFLPVIALAPAASTLLGAENVIATAGLVFTATLIGRPLGAAIFGPVADRVGRTATTRVALAGIAATTLLIAAVPGHEVLGWGTVALILTLRFLGGVFLGGEYTSAVPLAMEWSAPRRRGLASGLIMAMSPVANATIAALVLVLLAVLDPASYAAWGWRVPFVVGGILALVMLGYYRRQVADVPASHRAPAPASPLRDVLVGPDRRVFVQTFILMTGLWLLTYMAIPTLTAELTRAEVFDGRGVTLALLCATAVSAVAMALCGHLSTLVGRRRFFIGFGLLAAVLAPLAFLTIFAVDSPVAVIALCAALQVVTVSVYGPVGAYLSERFSGGVRSSGYGLGYSLSIVVPALYPYYLPPLQEAFGTYGPVAVLLVIAGLLVALGGYRGPDTDTRAPLR
ncbi:MHS family MFS transporter [Arthrobacter sp. NamB2]|nr:MHS family MFS transporter [Arthrobacter sp. NamB2]